ncbi:MAG: hypothetical protein AB1720_11125, partial [Pseudomonadota bacterium]
RPHIPALRVPENRACRVGGKELAPLYWYFEGERGSNSFAADPPGRLNFRRVCQGTKGKTSSAHSNRRESNRVLRWSRLNQMHKPPSHHRPGFDVLPLAAPPTIRPDGRISGEAV